MACGPCGQRAAAAANLRWVVDLAGQDKKFADGSVKKTFMTVGEANAELVKLGLFGKVKPRPATTSD